MGEGRATWARHDVATDGEVLYVESATPTGDTAAAVPLVLCHGLGGTHAVWYQQVARFSATRRVITWDARGFGASTSASGRAGVVEAAADLATVLDALDVPVAHVVGQSMGGWTALGFTLAHPERVRSLTLTNSLAGVATAAWVEQVRSAPPPAGPANVGVHPALGPSLIAADPAKAFLYQQLGSTREPPTDAMRSLLHTAFADDVLAAVRTPVLMIGSTDDAIFPPALLREAAARLPSARLEIVEGAGHSTYYERPEVWNELVGSFLAEVDAREAP